MAAKETMMETVENMIETTEELKTPGVAKKNIYQKLIEVRKRVPYLQKTAQGHQYNYVGSSNVLGALRGEMDKQGLILFPKVLDAKTTINSVENKDKYNNTKITSTYFTELTMEMVWVDAETGESIGVPFYAQGIDTGGEKGVGKALTYAEKYFLLKQFNIPTDQSDPDSFQNQVENSTVNFISTEQVEELKGYASKLSTLRNIAVDGVFTAINIPNVERLTQDNYMTARSSLLTMLEKAEGAKPKNSEVKKSVEKPKVKKEAVEQVKQVEVQNTAEPVQNEVQAPQKQAEVSSQPPVESETDSADLFVIDRIEYGNTAAKVAFAKVFATPKSGGSIIQIFANTPETLALAKGLTPKTDAKLKIEVNNGWNFLIGVGSDSNAS